VTDDEQRMQKVTAWLKQADRDDNFDLHRLASLMGVPAQELRYRAAQSRGTLPPPSWPGEGWAWEVREFSRWYKAGGLEMLATFARLNAR
jgi:hypothetical protein